jgi:uncharacterized hydrophobic protein (TIGR00271 family)
MRTPAQREVREQADLSVGGPRRARMDPEVRRRIVASLFPERAGWVRYGVLLALSTTIGAAGLLADSPAVVIGAMIVAPLMAPMQAMAIAIAMGWGRRLAVQSLVVGLSLAGCVVVAGAVSALAPGAQLTAEVLARTSPGVLDLVVALAAGTAGAVALTREDVSAALPGVAVAVALVPPLCAVGITIDEGRSDLAAGALLLFTTNLAAIVVSGVVVLFATGFVPFRVLRRSRPSAVAAFAIALVVVIAVSVPLTRASISVAEAAQDRQRVSVAIRDWLGPDSSLDLSDLVIGDERVVVSLAGAVSPPPAAGLSERIRAILPGVELDIRWSQQGRIDPDDDGRLDQDEQAAQVRSAIDDWLAGTERPFDVLATTVDGTDVVVDVAGPTEPPAAAGLADRLSESLGREVEVEVRWFQRLVFSSEVPVARPRPAELVREAAERWARGRDLAVIGVRVDDGEGRGRAAAIVLDLAGPAEPVSVDGLERAVLEAWAELDGGDPAPSLEVRFSLRRVLWPSTTTTAPAGS